MHNALLSLQIVAPIGCRNLTIICRYFGSEMRDEAIQDGLEMTGPVWGRFAGVNDDAIGDLPTVLKAVVETERQDVVRLINPMRLLELGFKAPEFHVGILLLVAGLDALLMAANGPKFEERLCNLLGADTYIFPPDHLWNHRPVYTVGEVVRDLYTLRSLIAHGKEITKKFQEERGFKTDFGYLPPEFARWQRWQYRVVLHECAVFLLCSTLHRVFTLNLHATVADEVKWRDLLNANC